MEMILLQIQSVITVLAATAEAQPWYYGVLFKVGPFIIVLGLLIFFHEMGHFLAAKFFGVKVERFSFGLGPRLVGTQGRGNRLPDIRFPFGRICENGRGRAGR